MQMRFSKPNGLANTTRIDIVASAALGTAIVAETSADG